MVVHGEDFVDGVFVRIDVDHLAEDCGMEVPAGCVAGFLRRDGAAQAKLGPVRAGLLILGRHAKIRVEMLSRHAQGDALV